MVEGDICHYDIIKGKTFEGTSKHREDILVIKKERELMIFKLVTFITIIIYIIIHILYRISCNHKEMVL